MTPAPSPPVDARLVEALLAFWADAGVDACLDGAPHDRLAAPPPRVAAPPKASPRPQGADFRSVPPPAATAAGEVEALAQAAAACGDLEALAAAARAAFPGPLVLWEGTAPARLAVLGDAPGSDDEAGGGPLRGARGAWIRALLKAAGIEEGALILNTVFRRMPGGADPTAAQQALAAPFVRRALALARPRAVLLLGACAVRGATGVEGPILKLRGAWLEGPPDEEGAPIPALATLGPDLLLRQPAARKAAWSDVLSLAARLAPSERDL